MNRQALRLVMILLAIAVAGGAACIGRWWLAGGALASAALEAFWLVRARTPLRIRRKPLRIGAGGGRG